MDKTGLNITPKEFKQLSKWAEDVYNIAVVVDYFCERQPEKEGCYNLAPVIRNLRNNADLLKAFLLMPRKIKINPSILFSNVVQKVFKRLAIKFKIIFG